ncbi:MAG: glycosyltransferase family 2 protein [Burkholderiales bacterium]|jgi:glycosyltransferase involved in cell wall biosynthesis|nr:glycosyltransferase family 2 protein [Burkholderiales bacterium]
MPDPTKVTIAIPTFRRPEMLRRALESVVRQNYAPLEVIVADNATEGDAVASVIASFHGRIEDLRYVRHEQNIGALDNFMFCLTQASGDYFMWLADDDELAADSIAALARPLDEDPTIVTVVPHWRLKRSPEAGWVVEQRAYESHSPLVRALRYVWRANDAFYYGLHRRRELLTCRFPNFVWPNAGVLADTAYPYLMRLVLTGRVVAVREPWVEWINHAYTEKSYANPVPFVLYAPKHVLRRINMHVNYLGQIGRALGWLAPIIVAPVSIASIVTELASGLWRKVLRSFGVQVEAVKPAGKR